MIGADVGRPLALQQDFAWLRQHREAGEQIGKIALKIVIGTAITGILAAFWLGFKFMLVK